ncbi:response regulator [Kitasatospora purpeofusca]|uniref:response regulator n=1 Tax=Kitasatospora purpeofusca TaxID=67352 RepID=UPI0038693A8C|nr:response regulator transcription factor [Kitasatospora purpeofusca]
MTVRVLVADDQALVRAGFAGILRLAPGFTVAGEAADGAEAVELAHRERPDVVLMDIRMPGLDGIEATRRIVAGPSGSRVLILSTYALDTYVRGALRAGAAGFLLKDAEPVELLAAVRAVAAGEGALAPGIARQLITELTELLAHGPGAAAEDPVRARARAAVLALTAREREVLALIGDGLTNPEIAARLHITEGTTKTHIGRLLHKLAARDRVRLAILAHRAGLSR